MELHWRRASDLPFLANGKPGNGTQSESGIEHLSGDRDGRTYLFFGKQDKKAKTGTYRGVEVFWRVLRPYLKPWSEMAFQSRQFVPATFGGLAGHTGNLIASATVFAATFRV